MDNLEEFKKYYNSDYWKIFKKKGIVFNIPKTLEERENLVEETYNDILAGTYSPDTPLHYIYADKGKGVVRTIPVFKLKDYIVYYYCIKKLEKVIAINRVENTFGGWSLGGVMRKNENEELSIRKNDYDSYEDFIADASGISISEYSFNPQAWSIAYGELNAMLYASAQETEYKHIAVFDISNFYDSIRLNILRAQIEEVSTDNFTINLLFHFLESVNTFNNSTLGLPQDALGDCSRILANFYLQEYDKFMHDLCKEYEARYLRYSDDQFVFVKEETDLNFLMYKSSKWLCKFGLSINQKKVQFYSSEQLITNRSFDIFDIISTDEDREDSSKVEKFVDRYLAILDSQGLDNLKDKGKALLNRLIFCKGLANIPYRKKIKIIACFLSNEYLSTSTYEHFKRIYNLLAKNEQDEFINQLNTLSDLLIHNRFHYQLVIFYEELGIETEHIKKRISDLENL